MAQSECNQISEITGLEHVSKLKLLELCDNKITRRKGLENLKNLVEVYLDGNPLETC